MTSAKLRALIGALLVACAAPVAAQDFKFESGQGTTLAPKRSAPVADPAEGHCILRVWVDDRATILMRGEQIAVRTHSGRPARDEGSDCSGPLPTNVENFRIESTSESRGRIRIQEPSQRNDYTGAISIDDPQDGGRLYVLDVWWRDASYNPRGREAAQEYRFVPGQGMTFAPQRSAPVANPAEGHCLLRVWVDDRATILLRGEQIAVRTHSGRPARDEGSICSGPLPTNVENFRIESTSESRGRIRIQEPSQRNDYTGAISIDDPQDGGRLYVLDVWWRDASYNPRGPRPVVGGPVFEGRDHEEACRRNVLHELRERNGRSVEVDFRRSRTEDQGRRETIRGNAIVRDRRDEARISYQCVVDNRSDRVISAAYEVRSDGSGIR